MIVGDEEGNTCMGKWFDPHVVYPMGYWTDLFYGEQFANHNTNSVDHSLKLSKSFMISPYREP